MDAKVGDLNKVKGIICVANNDGVSRLEQLPKLSRYTRWPAR